MDALIRPATEHPVQEINTTTARKTKNIRKFYNSKSLLDILITKLKKCQDISKIYISSNSKKIKNISKKNKCFYIERDFNAASYLQSRDRIHRKGISPDTKTNYYFLESIL